ncbi:MAG: cupin domain-containing protein [Betaproteobacteria bacterium]|nr:cupin domain-containing protein [Betaproteobacteria bacterium]
MGFQIRRVVTGHDKNGRAMVKMDSVPAASFSTMRPGVTACLAWSTDTLPADLGDEEDGGLKKVGTAHAGGTVFRIVEYQPGAAPRNHRTASIDYAVVMAGEIDMELDDGIVAKLKAGDILVQRGTIHNWINRGSVPCVMAFVLIDAKLPSFEGKQIGSAG